MTDHRQRAVRSGRSAMAQGIGNYKHDFADPEAGQVAFMGTMREADTLMYQGFNRPSSILVTEAFLIEDGKIRRVEMIGPSAPYHINSPWGGLSGN